MIMPVIRFSLAFLAVLIIDIPRDQPLLGLAVFLVLLAIMIQAFNQVYYKLDVIEKEKGDENE